MRNEGYFSRPFGRTYDTQAEKDILDGKISISQIPFEISIVENLAVAFS